MPGSRLPLRPLTRALAALSLASGAIALGGCDKITWLPDQPVEGWSPPVVLMHRGGGWDCGPDSTVPCLPNTLPAVLHGFATLDGAEVDIQISADTTVWLGHDNQALDCAGHDLGCFQDLTDAQIDAVAYCDGAAPCQKGSSPACLQHYVRAEEVFQDPKVSGPGADPSKLISLDVKGQYCRDIGVDEAKQMANEVDRLVRTYGMENRVLNETSQIAFLDKIQERKTPTYTFEVSLGDVDGPLGVAANHGAEGISFKVALGSEPMNADVVAGIHRKGYRIILWTINTPEDEAAAWTAVPDVIETDDPHFFSNVTP